MLSKVDNPRRPSRRRPPTGWGFVLILLFSSATCAGAGAGAAGDTRWLITGIDIRGIQRTRPDIVRRELLFGIGDTVDVARAAETERNLRLLLFLGRVSLHFEAHDSTAAAVRRARAVIAVEERRARALSPLLAGETGELSFGIVALDYNFLGRGQVTQLAFFRDAVTGEEIRGVYQNPRLRGSRQALHLEAGYAGGEGRRLAISLSQPFYTLDTPWAFGASLSTDQRRQRLYRRGDLTARYADHLTGGQAWLVYSADRAGLKVRPGLGLSVSDRRFDADAPFTYEPAPRRRVLPRLSVTLWRPRYARERFVLDLGRIEDLQTGSWLRIQAGLSARSLGSDRTFPVGSLQLAPRGRPSRNGFLFGLFSVNSRWRGSGPWHAVSRARLRGYLRVRERHVLAARVAVDALHRPEDGRSQLLLGVAEGLRGHGPRSFDGTRRLLTAIEARPVLLQQRLYVLGATLFADAGSAWTPGQDPRRWGAALGIGLRLALPTIYDAPILRADLARGFGADGLPRQLSLGLGHAF